MGASNPDEIPTMGKLGVAFGTIITVILGATMRGDWIMIYVHFAKQFGGEQSQELDNIENGTSVEMDGLNGYLAQFNLQNLHWMCLVSISVSYLSYYSLGGWLTWYYYILQKDSPQKWKCQPDRWLTPENERHEFLMGSANMFLGATISGIIATHVINGGYSSLYFGMLDRGAFYLVFSSILYFLIGDATAYYLHKWSHLPAIYKTIHKHHHRYHSPTAWSAVAMHPLEFLWLQAALVVPMFWLPMYSGSFISIVLYNYYYGMIDHSGVNMDALWPWQPPSIFHDDHHRYFHTNFGFNTLIWDKLHDTMRKKDRIYGEDVFYGKGKQKAR